MAWAIAHLAFAAPWCGDALLLMRTHAQCWTWRMHLGSWCHLHPLADFLSCFGRSPGHAPPVCLAPGRALGISAAPACPHLPSKPPTLVADAGSSQLEPVRSWGREGSQKRHERPWCLADPGWSRQGPQATKTRRTLHSVCAGVKGTRWFVYLNQGATKKGPESQKKARSLLSF